MLKQTQNWVTIPFAYILGPFWSHFYCKIQHPRALFWFIGGALFLFWSIFRAFPVHFRFQCQLILAEIWFIFTAIKFSWSKLDSKVGHPTSFIDGALFAYWVSLWKMQFSLGLEKKSKHALLEVGQAMHHVELFLPWIKERGSSLVYRSMTDEHPWCKSR